MSKYSLETTDGDNAVSICMNNKDCHFLDSFLDIYIDDEDAPSPFKNLMEAKLFATVIIDLLKQLDEAKERLNGES